MTLLLNLLLNIKIIIFIHIFYLMAFKESFNKYKVIL